LVPFDVIEELVESGDLRGLEGAVAGEVRLHDLNRAAARSFRNVGGPVPLNAKLGVGLAELGQRVVLVAVCS
jgi:hypothetical protein